MQDSLLSRFDLIFVMTDKADQQADLILADHVVRIHRYRAPGELDGEPTRMNSGVDWLSTMTADREEAERSTVFEKCVSKNISLKSDHLVRRVRKQGTFELKFTLKCHGLYSDDS